MLRWPDREAVRQAVTEWGRALMAEKPEVVAVGYFGSLASGAWGVGSDADLVLLVTEPDAPFVERAVAYPADELPVPADVLVYSKSEWDRLADANPFGRRLAEEVCWVARCGADAA